MSGRSARATSLAELDELGPRLFSAESRRRGLAFQPRPTDVIISPYAKCGTTWLQQIAHGLRTRGSMDFEEISVVVPWLEVAHRHQFDEAPFRRHWSDRGVLPFDSDAGKVTPGRSSAGQDQLPGHLHEELDEIWHEHIEFRCGLESYDALREELRSLHAV